MFLLLLFLLLSNISYTETRMNNLPQGFKWRYIMDETAPSPRSGQFWRSGILLEDKIIVLNAYNLIALDLKGKELWKKGLAAENPFSEAKIYRTESNEIVVIITDALIRINTDTGEMIKNFGYDVRKKSAFQFTELLPRHSILFKDLIYVFLGPQLISFHKKTLERNIVGTFNSSPKTLPIQYKDSFILGFLNNFVQSFNPISKANRTLVFGASESDFVIRQPVVKDELLFIPTSKDIQVYSNDTLFSKSDYFTNNILSITGTSIWLRQHQIGTIYKIDETLTSIKQTEFTPNKYASKIGIPLAGNDDILVHIDGIKGTLFIITQKPDLQLKKTIYSEEFIDNPPIQLLAQQNNLILLGGFEGLYLIDIDLL